MSKSVEDYTPSLAELGAIMRARTRDDLGKELGSFTDTTRPTGEEATGHIATAASLVSARLGGTVPDELAPLARAIVLLRAAMLVEVSYLPEEDGGDGSAYDRYQTEYEDALRDYDAAAGEDVGRGRRRVGNLRAATFLTSFPSEEP